MEKANPNSPKLTENDKKVLREIILHSKIADNKIANEMGISPQAVFKIRNKLEQIGIIKGYSPIIDFKKLGINKIALIILKFKPTIWKKYSEEAISDRIKKIPYIISAYRIANDAHTSHIILMGFRDSEQREHYITDIQTKFTNEIEINHIYSFSSESIITQNPIGLLNEMIDKTDFSKYTLFPIDKEE